MTHAQARAVVEVLQADPLYYRNFGVWWWRVKDELKRHGFTRENLHHLGKADDPAARRYYHGVSHEELDGLAFEHSEEHTFANYNDPVSYAPDHEAYRLHDHDAE